MRARRIIEGSAFGPEVIRIAVEAFEGAWSEIADRFDPAEHAAARERFAKLIISSTREASRDVHLLRGAGLRAMAREFPSRFSAPLPPRDTAGKKEN